MSTSKFVIINGSKYENEEVDSTEIQQTETDAKMTTKDAIYFPGYVVTKNDNNDVIIKRRKIS